MDNLNFDDFDNSPPPPRYLYKYLSTERVGNVLEDGTVRFTPLLNTNDTFEVRSTFNKLIGPDMRRMLFEASDDLLSKNSVLKLIEVELKEIGLDSFPPESALQFAKQYYGRNFNEILHKFPQQAIDNMLVPCFNDTENIIKLRHKLGELLCFSLSESMDSAPMWAHYAENNTGFVVAFDTEHLWFRQQNNGKKTRLQKVTYFDGKLVEPLDNLQAAFNSKLSDWAYEKEWRFYIKKGEADLIVGSADDPIQLIKFPKDAINRVILGPKTPPGVAARISEIITTIYRNTKVMRALPNGETHTYDEVPV